MGLKPSDLPAYLKGYFKASETSYRRGFTQGYRKGYSDAKKGLKPKHVPLPPHPCDVEGRPRTDNRDLSGYEE